VALRNAGFEDETVLVMGALSPVELREALAARAEVVVWSADALRAVAGAGGGRVHVKLDSGMGRLGTRDAREATEDAELAARTPGVELVGAMTHFATADDRTDAFFDRQLEVFAEWARGVKETHEGVVAHAANSAAVLRDRGAHFDMVRCGIAVYGMDPFGEDPRERGLEPALELVSYVAEVKPCAPGQSAGYGRRFIAERETHLGVLPIGYGDGWRRGLSGNADVLVDGRRRPLVGTVSMDNLTVELGAGSEALGLKGEEAVLIGERGGERLLAEELARRLQTINYEVTCGLTARVPRLHHRDGVPMAATDLRPLPAEDAGGDAPAAGAAAATPPPQSERSRR
jgi:alanine racemase